MVKSPSEILPTTGIRGRYPYRPLPEGIQSPYAHSTHPQKRAPLNRGELENCLIAAKRPRRQKFEPALDTPENLKRHLSVVRRATAFIERLMKLAHKENLIRLDKIPVAHRKQTTQFWREAKTYPGLADQIDAHDYNPVCYKPMRRKLKQLEAFLQTRLSQLTGQTVTGKAYAPATKEPKNTNAIPATQSALPEPSTKTSNDTASGKVLAC